jgi:hypothetical protein
MCSKKLFNVNVHYLVQVWAPLNPELPVENVTMIKDTVVQPVRAYSFSFSAYVWNLDQEIS